MQNPMTFLELLELKHFGKLNQETVINYANASADFSNKWLVHSIRSQCSLDELATAIAANIKWKTSALTSLEEYLEALCTSSEIPSSIAEIEQASLFSQNLINDFCPVKQKTILINLRRASTEISQKDKIDENKFTRTILVDNIQINEIISSCAPYLKDVSLFGDSGKNSRNESIRNNTHLPTPIPNDSMALALLENLIAKASGETISFAEPPVILRYQTGQYYKWHYDYIYPHTDDIQSHITQFGQRVKTAIFYFNDNFIGGETEFKTPFISVPPKKNKVLVFNNCDSTLKRDPSSIHRGNAVTSGDKWIMTLWFRNKPFWLRTGLM